MLPLDPYFTILILQHNKGKTPSGLTLVERWVLDERSIR